MGFAPAVELAIWLNQFRKGAISSTDATNAAETITNCLAIESLPENQGHLQMRWSEVIEKVAGSTSPCFAFIPSSGRTYGLTSQVIANLDLNSGVCVVDSNVAIGSSSKDQNKWILIVLENPLVPLDAKTARLELQELITRSAADFTSMQLAGQRESIDKELANLEVTFLPSSIDKKVMNDLELSGRVLLIAQRSLDAAKALDSRSLDEQKTIKLRGLQNAALDLIAATTYSS